MGAVEIRFAHDKENESGPEKPLIASVRFVRGGLSASVRLHCNVSLRGNFRLFTQCKVVYHCTK